MTDIFNVGCKDAPINRDLSDQDDRLTFATGIGAPRPQFTF